MLAAAYACQRDLDKDGGYYDEKTRSYKYVNPTGKSSRNPSMIVYSPIPGKRQQIHGVVTKIGTDLKSIWVRIKDRKPYQILAAELLRSNRNDKDKELRISLEYVSPLGSLVRDKAYRKKWQDFVTSTLEKQLLNQRVFVEIEYEENAMKLWGTVSKVIRTKKGDRIRNINRWMVQSGLSYYFIDRGKSPVHNQFIQAQKFAGQTKSGLWNIQ